MGISDDGGAFEVFMQMIHILTRPVIHTEQKLNWMTFFMLKQFMLKITQKMQSFFTSDFPGRFIGLSQMVH